MRARADLPVGFWLVFWRELGWLRRRRFLLALTTLVPLSLMALLSAIFSAGLPVNLPIAVLDLDDSALSREIIRRVDATPDVAVAQRVADLGEGARLIRAGPIYGLLMLPRDLERDAQAGRRPEIVYFYNTQMMTPGNLTLRGINAAAPTAAAGIRISLRSAHGQPVEAAKAALAPVPVQIHPLFNPTLNYVHFLLAAILPAVLQIVITTGSAYSVGLDAETPHRLRVLRRLGGGLWPAMAGKLAPYTLLFLFVLGLSDAVLFGALEAPLRGSGGLLLAAGFLFILCCQLIGGLLALLLRPMATAISLATLATAPAFGFMGIGFPRLGMNAFALGWGALLPGTWYLQARIDQTVRGAPLDLSLKPILILLALAIGLAALAAWRLETLRARQERGRERGRELERGARP